MVVIMVTVVAVVATSREKTRTTERGLGKFDVFSATEGFTVQYHPREYFASLLCYSLGHGFSRQPAGTASHSIGFSPSMAGSAWNATHSPRAHHTWRLRRWREETKGMQAGNRRLSREGEGGRRI